MTFLFVPQLWFCRIWSEQTANFLNAILMQLNLNKFADIGWSRITNIKNSDLVDFCKVVRGLKFIASAAATLCRCTVS